MASRQGGLAGRIRVSFGALELDRVAVGVPDIDRLAFALGAVARAGRDDGNTVALQMGAQARLVERPDSQADMVDIAALRARRGPAGAAERAGDVDEVDQRARPGATARRPSSSWRRSSGQPSTSR